MSLVRMLVLVTHDQYLYIITSRERSCTNGVSVLVEQVAKLVPVSVDLYM